MIPDGYVWLAWASAFMIPWGILFFVFPRYRRVMLLSSLYTAPFGLTEPLFVPEYWSPPSLFDLARRTGFDIESLIFCFAIGGVGSVLYNVLTGKALEPLPASERKRRIHRYHLVAMLSPVIVFLTLVFLPWNPIYPGIIAMMSGAIATGSCRRDLLGKTWIGGAIFLIYYVVFLVGLEAVASGYIERVWNLGALSGVAPFGLPVEELLFATAFGMYWSGVYEHLTWATGVAPVGRSLNEGNPHLAGKLVTDASGVDHGSDCNGNTITQRGRQCQAR